MIHYYRLIGKRKNLKKRSYFKEKTVLTKICVFLLLKGIEERCDNEQHQQEDEGADQP